jgi:hypothetical protein
MYRDGETMCLMSTPSPCKNKKSLQQTKPYADPCKDGEEKAKDDHRRPLALIKLSSVLEGVKIASGG